jgi:hypothetical protein
MWGRAGTTTRQLLWSSSVTSGNPAAPSCTSPYQSPLNPPRSLTLMSSINPPSINCNGPVSTPALGCPPLQQSTAACQHPAKLGLGVEKGRPRWGGLTYENGQPTMPAVSGVLRNFPFAESMIVCCVVMRWGSRVGIERVGGQAG